MLLHDKDWSISFFQSFLGISSFDLICTNMSFEVKNKDDIDDVQKSLSRAFPQFEIINPMYEIDENIDLITKYLTIGLLAFSALALVISSLLLIICINFHLIENVKDIGLARCLGISKKESTKFLIVYALCISVISSAISSLELTFLWIVTNLNISPIKTAELKFELNPLSFLLIFIVSISISLVSSLIISKRTISINPLDILKK